MRKSLTYCTNVHALTDLEGWKSNISFFGKRLSSALKWKSMPLGLWFHAGLLDEILKADAGGATALKDWMEQRSLSVFTLNAFPFGNFHEKSVKYKVYHPDWTHPDRLRYTENCAKLLSMLLDTESAGETGSISTLPLGWRHGWTEAHSQASAKQLILWVKHARRLADSTGKRIRLGLEPEPGCILEETSHVISFWERYLRPLAAREGIRDSVLNEYIGVCYDTCHHAVLFELPARVLEAYVSQGIPIIKMQLSNALEFKSDVERVSLPERRTFVEERFLHQTRIRSASGITGFDDLPEALANPGADWGAPWRVHYHVPVDSYESMENGRIATTRQDMEEALSLALEKDLCDHFEVETYTWSVLPEKHRPVGNEELARCLAGEIQFVSRFFPDGALIHA